MLARDGDRDRCSAIHPVGEAPSGGGALLQLDMSPLLDTAAAPHEDGDALAGALQLRIGTRSDRPATVLRAFEWDEEASVEFVHEGKRWEAVVHTEPGPPATLHLNLRRGAEVVMAQSYPIGKHGAYARYGHRLSISVRPTAPGALPAAP